MNGVDPAPEDITLEEGFFTKHQVKVFCYNEQVVDSLTSTIKQTALSAKVPVVGVYETMPTPGYDYQSWMLAEVTAIEGGYDTDRRRNYERTSQSWKSTASTSRWVAASMLDHVSFDVREGEFTGLIGSNGVGKTTLLRTILGLQRPDDGRVPGRRRAAVAAQSLARLRAPEDRRRSRRADAGTRLRRPRPRRASLRHCEPERATTRAGRADPARRRRGRVRRQPTRESLRGRTTAGPHRTRLGQPTEAPCCSTSPSRTWTRRACRTSSHSCTASRADYGVAILLSAHEMNALLPVMDRIVYLTGGRAASGTTDEVIRSEVLSQLYGHHVDVSNCTVESWSSPNRARA